MQKVKLLCCVNKKLKILSFKGVGKTHLLIWESIIPAAAFGSIMSFNQQSKKMAAPFYSLLPIIALYLGTLRVSYLLHSPVRRKSIVQI